jgi:hypothetical protein
MKTRAQMYDELLQQSKARRDENIVAHKARTARIRNGKSLRARLNPRAVAQTPLDFLAIGDSWFEYPLYDNGPMFEETGIVAPVQLQSMGSPPPQILNLAVHGQAATAMLSWENQETLLTLLQDPDQWLNTQTNLPDAILVSAGGDDVVGDQFAVYLDYGGGGLDVNRFQGALGSVRASYEDLFAFRDLFAPNVPIFGHCYDYALPNGVVPMCVQTAWLQPSLDFAGYDYTQGLAIVKTMIDMFHDMLFALAANRAYNFTLIDTRGIVTPDATSSTGWSNEIHPRFAGFTALAKKFLAIFRAGIFRGQI